MYSSYLPICLILLVYLPIRPTIACNGYDVNINEIGNCEGSTDNIIQLENVTASLDKNCFLSVEGCFRITKEFSRADVNYVIVKGIFVLPGSFDPCKLIGVCPLFKPTNLCVRRPVKINISQFQKKLKLLKGRTKVKVTINHGVGSSCIFVDLKVTPSKQNA